MKWVEVFPEMSASMEDKCIRWLGDSVVIMEVVSECCMHYVCGHKDNE